MSPRPAAFLRFLVVAFCTVAAACAQPYVAGQTYFGRNNYIEYRAGDLPLILTASHGGTLTPSEIPDRTYGTTTLDTNTRELAIACYNEIVARTGKRPHLILCHLRRTKLDANREIVEAAQGNSFAEQAWTEFHDYIAAARSTARSDHGFAHLIDLHGHGHDIDRLELGYGLGADELNITDTALNNPGYAWMSTLRTLTLARPGVPFSTLLRGSRSFGDLCNLRGVPAWPSPDFPSPGTAEFFNGGYIVRTHTCLLDNDSVRGLQIESHFTGVRDSSASRADFASRLANVLQPYLWDNYGYDIKTLSLSRVDTPAATVINRGGAPLVLTVRRTGYLALSSTMNLSFGGTAVRGASGDYVASATSLSFSANATTATLTLTPNAATSSSGDKTLVLTLAPSATQTADLTPLVLTLADGTSQVVRATPLTPSLSEAAGPARFRLTRTQTASALTVPLLWSGTALAGPDYGNAPASVTFAAGTSTLDIDVPLIDDGRPAPDRTLTLNVGSAAGQPGSATAAIRDDDRPAGLAVWLRGDLAGNLAIDSSGLDRHATTLPANETAVAGPAAITVASAANAPAIAFDGADDTVILPKFILDPSGAFSLSFFFRLDSGGTISGQNLACYGTRSAAGSLHVYLATTNSANGTVALRTNLPGLSASALDVSRTSPSSWQDGVWRHYTLSVGADGTARVYLNGALQRTATGRTGSLNADELLALGWRPFEGPSTAFMLGALRDVRVYQRALPAAEVTALNLGRTSFASWLGANNLAASSAITADPDADGLPLFLEYGLAASPLLPSQPPRYEVGVVNDRLTLSFLRETAAADLIWTIEGSDSLGTWQNLARRTASDTSWSILVSGASVSDANGLVTFTDAFPLTLQPRRFLRLRVGPL
jgi:hypothetical protein